MDECKCTLSKRLTGDGCRYCQPQEYIDRMGEWLDEERADIDAKDAEIERLNALVAMQAEALINARNALYIELYVAEHPIQKMIAVALSATAKTVSAWKNEIQANAIEKLIFSKDMTNTGYIGRSVLIREVNELRAKGE